VLVVLRCCKSCRQSDTTAEDRRVSLHPRTAIGVWDLILEREHVLGMSKVS
jgi:hypothetical protein